MKKGAAEALRKHREDIAAGTEQLPQDPQLYWARMRPICATRLADVPGLVSTFREALLCGRGYVCR